MSDWTRRGFLVGTAGAAACAGRVGCGRPLSGLPSVLMIVLDQLRAQALSLAGDPNVHTPAMDGLLQQSAWLRQTFVTNPLCSPSRASMLTGLYPRAAGVVTNRRQVRTDVPTLATVLRAQGRKAGYIGKWHLARAPLPGFVAPGLRGGFDDFWAAYNVLHAYTDSRYFLDDDVELRPSPRDTYEPIYQTDQALELLGAWRHDDFLISVNYGPPHPAGNWRTDWGGHIPQRYLAGIDAAKLQLRPNVPAWAERRHASAVHPKRRDPGARAYLRYYYAAVQSVDEQVGRLLAGLERLGLADRTIVVLTSDHGDLAGSHGLYKKQKAHDEAANVPLGIRWPGHIEPKAIDFPMSLADLMPTLVGLCGAEVPPGLHGRDRSALLTGGPAPDLAPLLYGSFLGIQEHQFFTLRTPEWAYTEYDGSGASSLYDMEADPYQQTDLAGTRPSLQRQLSEQLTAERVRVGEPLPRWRVEPTWDGPGPPVPGPSDLGD